MKTRILITPLLVVLFLVVCSHHSEGAAYTVIHDFSITPDEACTNVAVTGHMEADAYAWEDGAFDEDHAVSDFTIVGPAAPTQTTINAHAVVGRTEADANARLSITGLELANVSGNVSCWGSATANHEAEGSEATAHSEACYAVWGSYELRRGELTWQPLLTGYIDATVSESWGIVDPISWQTRNITDPANVQESEEHTLLDISLDMLKGADDVDRGHAEWTWDGDKFEMVATRNALFEINIPESPYLDDADEGTLGLKIKEIFPEGPWGPPKGEVDKVWATGVFSHLATQLPAVGAIVDDDNPVKFDLENEITLHYDLSSAPVPGNPTPENTEFCIHPCGGGETNAIPEPTTTALLGLGVLALRRKRQS